MMHVFLWFVGEKNDGWFGFFQFFTSTKPNRTEIG
jgi:hypothetical protein